MLGIQPLFFQEFDDRKNKTNRYSKQNSLNTDGLKIQGTNNIKDTAKQDIICNVWDMSSNILEYTTETSKSSYGRCVARGGVYDNNKYYTSKRIYSSVSASGGRCTFRLVFYL